MVARSIPPAEPLVFPGNMFQTTQNMGLTKREYFAAIILSGMLANPCNAHQTSDGLVVDAVELAENLVSELQFETDGTDELPDPEALAMEKLRSIGSSRR